MKVSYFFSFFFAFTLMGCSIFILPTNTPPNTGGKPSNSGGTKPTDTSGTKPTDTGGTKPTDTGSTKPMDSNTGTASKLKDPDNLKPIFTLPESDLYLQTFTGTARAASKTSICKAKTEFFADTKSVLATLKTDDYMRTQVNDHSPRNVDEERNVFIGSALIFSIKKEADGDYHVIIGDTLNGEKVNMINVEIAGLPKDTTTLSYKILERTRRQFYEHFPEFFNSHKKTFIPRSVYPVIALRGSLFFDTHHEAGSIGEGSSKPNTVWELHPVTYIEFK